jgi:hypothetical protein
VRAAGSVDRVLCWWAALAGQGKYAAAEAAYRKALALMPTSAHTYFLLAELLGRLGKHREEEAAYRKALALWPAFAEAHYSLGKCLTAQGNHGEAAAAYRAAITHRRNFADAHINLSLGLWRMARFDEAAVQVLEPDRLLPPKDARRESARQPAQAVSPRADLGREKLEKWLNSCRISKAWKSRNTRKGRVFRGIHPPHFLNGVQEVAGSNPVAPTFARPVGTTSSDWPFSHLGGSFRPQGQSCGQTLDRSVPPDTLPRPLDSWLLPSSQRYGRVGSTPSWCEHQARTLGHK